MQPLSSAQTPRPELACPLGWPRDHCPYCPIQARAEQLVAGIPRLHSPGSARVRAGSAGPPPSPIAGQLLYPNSASPHRTARSPRGDCDPNWDLGRVIQITRLHVHSLDSPCSAGSPSTLYRTGSPHSQDSHWATGAPSGGPLAQATPRRVGRHHTPGNNWAARSPSGGLLAHGASCGVGRPHSQDNPLAAGAPPGVPPGGLLGQAASRRRAVSGWPASPKRAAIQVKPVGVGVPPCHATGYVPTPRVSSPAPLCRGRSFSRNPHSRVVPVVVVLVPPATASPHATSAAAVVEPTSEAAKGKAVAVGAKQAGVLQHAPTPLRSGLTPHSRNKLGHCAVGTVARAGRDHLCADPRVEVSGWRATSQPRAEQGVPDIGGKPPRSSTSPSAKRATHNSGSQEWRGNSDRIARLRTAAASARSAAFLAVRTRLQARLVIEVWGCAIRAASGQRDGQAAAFKAVRARLRAKVVFESWGSALRAVRRLRKVEAAARARGCDLQQAFTWTLRCLARKAFGCWRAVNQCEVRARLRLSAFAAAHELSGVRNRCFRLASTLGVVAARRQGTLALRATLSAWRDAAHCRDWRAPRTPPSTGAEPEHSSSTRPRRCAVPLGGVDEELRDVVTLLEETRDTLAVLVVAARCASLCKTVLQAWAASRTYELCFESPPTQYVRLWEAEDGPSPSSLGYSLDSLGNTLK